MRLFNRTESSLLTPEEHEQRRGLIYAIALHLGLFLVLLIGLFSAPKDPHPVQIELWAEGEMAVAENRDEPVAQPDEEPVVEPEPQPEPQPEPEPEPEPPAPEPEPQAPEPEPAPDIPAPKVTPPPAEDPEIALEKARKEKAEADKKAKAEAERIAKEEAEQKAKAEAERKAKAEAERKAKAEAEQKAKAEAERIAKEEAEQKAKAEAERKAKAEAEQKAKAEAERKAKAEAEQKAKAEAERKAKAEAEQKAKAEAERKAKAEAERKAKAEAERKAKAAADKKAKEDAFRAALLGDGKQIAGASGGTADRNQVGGSGGDNGYGAKVRACVRPRVVYNTPPRSGSTNPALQYRVDLNSDGTVRNVRITRSSGIALFDDAVQKGIAKCSPFPKPSNGRYPSFIDGEYRMYD
ncbi:colicin import membrane protein [Paenalcaligenes hominis]|uniref:Colicin import membrane protein n=1 Tax=Paenalcaligenes hominis TaxID=643674 RepID=A0ABX0WUC0_9BURK|nr:cell envelope integrity protein TolA [Paenalcaligenes hominis]NJB66347.1 colicin import membrane protein [Paenalcaligenes hominis]